MLLTVHSSQRRTQSRRRLIGHYPHATLTTRHCFSRGRPASRQQPFEKARASEAGACAQPQEELAHRTSRLATSSGTRHLAPKQAQLQGGPDGGGEASAVALAPSVGHDTRIRRRDSTREEAGGRGSHRRRHEPRDDRACGGRGGDGEDAYAAARQRDGDWQHDPCLPRTGATRRRHGDTRRVHPGDGNRRSLSPTVLSRSRRADTRTIAS